MNIVNEKITECRIRTFLMNGKVISPILVCFFHLSNNKWVSLTIGEGCAQFCLEKETPVMSRVSNTHEDIEYPIRKLDLSSDYIGKKIRSISEYRLKKDSLVTVGVCFEFDDCYLSVVEDSLHEDNLDIVYGLSQELLQDTKLVKNENLIIEEKN